jgi:hypothetical protein
MLKAVLLLLIIVSVGAEDQELLMKPGEDAQALSGLLLLLRSALLKLGAVDAADEVDDAADEVDDAALR